MRGRIRIHMSHAVSKKKKKFVFHVIHICIWSLLSKPVPTIGRILIPHMQPRSLRHAELVGNSV